MVLYRLGNKNYIFSIIQEVYMKSINSMERIFTRGIASGNGFCNREKETGQIIGNIKNITQTLLISPRRYGKTSLALHAIEQSKYPYAYIDLFMKYDSDSIFTECYREIGRLISKITTPTEKTIRAIENIFKNMKFSLVLGPVGLELSMLPVGGNKIQNIKELFLGVDDFLNKNQQKAIIFIDEVQTITETEICNEIESSLRFIAQKTNNISFVFSGSSRHLLNQMFNDRDRPFYKLCYQMNLERIEEEHYIKFINKFAMQKWKKLLNPEIFREIFGCTKCHPYYVNVLCERIFAGKNIPTQEDIDSYWEDICREEQGAVAKDLECITAKQKLLLGAIAKHPGLKEPTAKAFVNKINLTPRGITLAMQGLVKHGLVEKLNTGEIRIIDPVLEKWSR